MEIIHVIPDSPMSVLELFQPTKEGIKAFASKISEDVKEGRVNPLRVKLLCNTLQDVAEQINAQTKPNQCKEAQKYGEKPFMYHGAEMHYTSTRSEYDYSSCGDPEYDDLVKEFESIQKKIVSRKEWLKTMGKPENVISKHGEGITIYPPIKKTHMGVKVTFK